jgi:predicted RNA-binding Zn ribbon-like protein
MRHSKIPRRRAPCFELAGGVLCLDFVNTLDNRPSENPKELLESYLDLARFAEDTGILTPAQAERVCAYSYKATEDAEKALHAAIELREALHAIFAAIVYRRPGPPAALTTLNAYVQESAQHLRLVEGKGQFEWQFDEIGFLFEGVLWPIARSAADLLASYELNFVRACSSKTCQWLFLDTSKNHRRRWCDMRSCGNRAKVRRFYARQKKAAQ